MTPNRHGAGQGKAAEGVAATRRCRTGDRYAENSVPVAWRLDIVLRSRRIAAVAIKVIATLKTAERPGLALLNAEMEPWTVRIRRTRALAGAGLMVRIGIIEVIVAVASGPVASGPKHLLSERPPGGGRRCDYGRCNRRRGSEPKPDKQNHDRPHVGTPKRTSES